MHEVGNLSKKKLSHICHLIGDAFHHVFKKLYAEIIQPLSPG